MINKLRFKFIKITGLSILAVLLSIIAAINVVNVVQNNKSLDSVTEMLIQNGGTLKKEIRPDDSEKHIDIAKKDKANDAFHNKKELPFSSRYFSFDLNSSKEITSANLANIASVDESEAKQIAEAILKKGRNTGWYKNYRFRIGTYEGKYLLVALEATATRTSLLTVLTISVAVGLIAFLIVMLLVTALSKKAISPIAETYDKQKRFITDASHELKTPLTVISANSEILSLTYGENEWCAGIENQAGIMRELIGQMIQMSKLDEDELPLTFEKFSLSDAAYDTFMTFSPIAEKRGISMTADIAPDISFCGDEGALRQVVSIITDNAVKYCDENGSVSALLTSSGRHTIFSVRNSFADADTLDINSIFERFYRGDASHSVSHSYGLGLAIAKAIVEKHKCSICAVKHDKEIEIRITL